MKESPSISAAPLPEANDRRKTAQPPAKRGRRGHGVFDQIPSLATWVETEFVKVPRPTFREIAERLAKSEFWPLIQKEGYATGKTAIYAYWKKWKNQRIFRTSEGSDPLAGEARISALINAAIEDELEREMSRGGGLTKPQSN